VSSSSFRAAAEVARGFPHASLEHRVVFAALHEELPPLQRALGGDEDRLHVDGLGDEIVGSALEALDGRLDVARARDDDDGASLSRVRARRRKSRPS